jgi:ADP-heptose:LPS heptosyltransferase
MKTADRISRIALLVRCIIRAVFYGTANQIPTNISKIIVVPTGKLGDVVCATPVLVAIRTYLPNVHLIVAGNSKLHCSILADSGLVDEYIDLQEEGALTRLKSCRAEAGLVTGPSYEPTALLYIAGTPLVVAARVEGGFSPAETRLYKILRHFIKTFPYRIDKYAPRERLRVLEPLGIFSDDTKKHLGFSKIADKRVKHFLIDNGINIDKNFVMGISVSAGNKIKEWPEERFAQIADYLVVAYGAKIIIIGGLNDKEKIKKTKDYLNHKTEVLEITDFNIDELKALVAKLHLFISVDTGPIYIAEAFDVPTIDIVGPVDENVQPPRGLIHRNVIPPQRVRPELSILNARMYNKEEALRQTLSTTVQDVSREIDGLIRDIYKHRMKNTPANL